VNEEKLQTAPETPKPARARTTGSLITPLPNGVPAAQTPTPAAPSPEEIEPSILRPEGSMSIEVERLSFWYGLKKVLYDIGLSILERRVTAFIGPSGCGKSTLLRTLNRLNDLVDGSRVSGEIRLKGQNIFAPEIDVNDLRRRVGMVFQKSNPFPKTVFENVAYGLRIGGENNRGRLRDRVEHCLKRAGLWEEVADRLDESALDLSGGQQQRLCIARAIAVEPEVVLMDEPCSALDPIATGRIEELIGELKEEFTIIIVTHNMQQASRISDYTAFLWLGRLVEYGETSSLFTRPQVRLTEDYITGRFG
jgi:phosphate transport system ATP-binding protein